MAGFGHLFQKQAASYAAHRPTYPPQLYDLIYGFAGLKSKETALDIATGSGQAAKVLAQSFQKVRDGLRGLGHIAASALSKNAENVSIAIANELHGYVGDSTGR